MPSSSKDKKEINYHAEHRKRLRKRYIEHGITSFEPHALLELILTYAIPRVDVNPTAHRLMRHFGSLSEVFNASVAELTSIEGVGEASAVLLTLFKSAYHRTMLEAAASQQTIKTALDAYRILLPYFQFADHEMVYAISINANGRILRSTLLSQGSLSTVLLNIQRVAEIAVSGGCAGVIIAHNHPNGLPLPSEDDIETTFSLIKALKSIHSALVDHIILTDTDYVSLAEAGIIRSLEASIQDE